MQSMNIVTVPEKNGQITGWLRHNPGVVAQGSNYPEVVKNLIEAYKTFVEMKKEAEEDSENKKS